MRYQLIILDFDGTLADSAAWFLGALDGVADRFGFRRCTPEEIEALRAKSSREIIRAMGIPAWKLPFIAAHMRRLSREGADSIALFPGIEAFLAGLHADGVAIAVASSNGEETIRRVLGPRLSAMVASFECGSSMFGKAARIRRLLRRSGVPASAVMLIGDETRDIEAARKAGVAGGAACWGYAKRGALEAAGPTVVFPSVAAMTRHFALPALAGAEG